MTNDIHSWANICYICKKETYTTEELLTLDSPKDLGGIFHKKCFEKLCKNEGANNILDKLVLQIASLQANYKVNYDNIKPIMLEISKLKSKIK